MQESKSCALPLGDTPIYGPESWNRTNDVPQPSRNRTGWAITPLYHFSLSPYIQGTTIVALPLSYSPKGGKIGFEPTVHKMCDCCVCLYLSHIYIISYFFIKIKLYLWLDTSKRLFCLFFRQVRKPISPTAPHWAVSDSNR